VKTYSIRYLVYSQQLLVGAWHIDDRKYQAAFDNTDPRLCLVPELSISLALIRTHARTHARTQCTHSIEIPAERSSSYSSSSKASSMASWLTPSAWAGAAASSGRSPPGGGDSEAELGWSGHTASTLSRLALATAESG
jgi:hypothetical protein